MPGWEKDRTMRTVSSPWTLGRFTSRTVPRHIRKTMNPTNTEKGLEVSLVVIKQTLWQKKKRINNYLWQFVVDLRRAWIYREKNFSSLTKSFISRRLAEPPPVAPVMITWGIRYWIRQCVAVKKWGKPLGYRKKVFSFLSLSGVSVDII